MNRFWQALEAFPNAQASIAEWQQTLGPAWVLAKAFLQPTPEFATTYPHPTLASPYFVQQVADNQWIGVCSETGSSCSLNQDQLRVWKLKDQALTQAIRQSLDLGHSRQAEFIDSNLWHLGGVPTTQQMPWQIYLALAHHETLAVKLISQFLREPPGPIALLVPTRRLIRRGSQNLFALRSSFWVPLEEATQFQPDGTLRWLKPLLSWQAQRLVVPDVVLADKRGIFRRRVDQWEITFEDQTETFPTEEGFWFLAFVIRQRPNPVPTTELVAWRDEQSTLQQGGLPTTDAKAIQQLRQQLENDQAMLEEAKRHQDLGQIEHYQTQIHIVQQQLIQDLGLHDLPRQQKSHAERARSRVTKAIHRAQDKISKKMPTFYQHLAHVLTTGLKITYDSNITWECDW